MRGILKWIANTGFVEMAKDRKALKKKAKAKLWLRSGGRCQYRGCNKPLWRDDLTMAELNGSNIAHIHGVAKSSARHIEQYEDKVDSFENLMLMCYDHHHLIDNDGKDWESHTADALRSMKKQHEDRIDLLCSLTEDWKSDPLIYGKPIGNGQPIITPGNIFVALQPDRYPTTSEGTIISLRDQTARTYSEAYWKSEEDHLRTHLNSTIIPRLRSAIVNHLSIFAMAPQPLLILLGHLIGDMVPTEIDPFIKETGKWGWKKGEDKDFDIIINRPKNYDGPPALLLSFSATVTRDRIYPCFNNEKPSIWEMTIPSPNTDWLYYRNQLACFCNHIRKVFEEIKKLHGHHSELHVFPAAPIPINIELGRQHKDTADLPLRIYNEDYTDRKFKEALKITL